MKLSPALQRTLQIGLSGTAVALLGMAIPAVQKFITHADCVAAHSAPRYTFLPDALNEALCGFNVVFSAAYSTPAGAALLGEFGAFFASPALILAHDHGLTGVLVMLVGQIVPVCIVYPSFAAISAYKRPRHPSPREVLASLAAVTVGYILTGTAALQTNLGYGALAIWQIYPVLILLLLLVLRPLVRALGIKGGGARTPAALTAAVGIATSIAGHRPLGSLLLSGDVSLADVFYPTADTFADTALWIFVVDFVVVFLSAALVALGSGRQHEVNGPTVLLLLFATVVLGPGAGVMLVWATQRRSK